MAIPKGFTMAHGADPSEYILKLVRNLYGQKQAGRVWNKFLHKGLLKAGFTQLSINKCVYYRGRTIFLVYIDDGLFFALAAADSIDKAIKDIKDQGYNISVRLMIIWASRLRRRAIKSL